MTSLNKSDPDTIKKMFGAIASNYDNANTILSFNLHKGWNKQLVAAVTQNEPEILLDLCAGTGEIAYIWLKQAAKKKKAILLDFCPEMLAIAEKSKPSLHEVSYIIGDAQSIPLEDSSVDAITIAYGIRNVKEPAKCFQEAYRVLKPKGILSILELTEPSNRLIGAGHKFYLSTLLPFLGGLITREPDAYRYLSSSIQAFTKPAILSAQLKEAGFYQVQAKPLTFGIAHLFTAFKI